MKIRIPLRIVWDRLRATHLTNPWVSGLHNCPLPATQRPQVPGSRFKTRTTRTGLRSRFRSFCPLKHLTWAWGEADKQPWRQSYQQALFSSCQRYPKINCLSLPVNIFTSTGQKHQRAAKFKSLNLADTFFSTMAGFLFYRYEAK